MIYESITTGILGFLAIYLFDFVSLKKIPAAKTPAWILGNGLLAYSLGILCLAPDKLPLPAWVIWSGWGFLTISLLLLIYSLFINLPFRKTYVNSGVSDKLITTGGYALVRHPGLHWFTLFVLSLILVSRSSELLVAAPIFVLMDIVLVVIQDKFVFCKMFDGYDSYRQETPMLLPNRQSLNAFIHSLKQANAQNTD